MRFALRNKHKLVKAFGLDYYNLLVKSLEGYFKTTVTPEEHSVGGVKDPMIFVPSVQKNTDTDFQFVVLGKTYDVYRLAYYSAMG